MPLRTLVGASVLAAVPWSVAMHQVAADADGGGNSAHWTLAPFLSAVGILTVLAAGLLLVFGPAVSAEPTRQP
jgi:hypothetical protein